MEQPTQVWSALVGLLVFTLTLPIVPDAHAGSSTIAPSARAKLLRADQVYDKFAHGQARVTVIVNLAPPARAAQPTDWNAAQSLQTLHAANQTTEDQVLGTLAAGEHKIRFRFHNQAGFSCEVTEKALDQLLNNPLVETVEPVRELEAHLAQGIPLMNALASRSTYNGTNMAIAICDTGIDYNHPRLGGGGFPNSKILGGYDFGDSDSDPIPNTQAHGTCCAGIAAGDLGTVGDYIGGVAPGAKLYALKISFGSTGSAYDDAMVAAWDWCVTHKNDNPAYPIMVISTSFGGGQLFSACDGDVPAMTTAANNAVAAGITVLASSGNDGFCDSIAWPACISNVISVGAVYDANFGTYQPCVSAVSCAPKTATIYCSTGYYATDSTAPDKVTSYSNVASFLDVFAPANQCYTLDITGSSGYDSGDYYAGFGGTSAACPYTAGAIACLQNAAKVLTGSYLTPAEVRSRLASSGNLITDTKVAITKPRVNLGNAIDSMSTALRVTPVTGLAASGPFGGPFSPSSQIYSLSNSTVSSLSWSASKGQTWVSVSAVSGTLTAGASTNVTVSINSIADGLGMGTYNDTVTFSNITAGTGQPRAVSLSIEPPHIYYFPLDTDPGWTKQGEWAFGHPTGQGGTVHGNPDPSNGATGTNVFGTNLSGDYSLSVGGPYYLTAGPLNFSGYTNTQLRFQRWLNTDFQPYVYATIDISTNGTTWTQIWSNGAAAEIADSSWASFQYDISALADNHAIVYIRWSYQVASAAFAYSGWNIDDIELLGTPMGSAALAVTPTNDLVSAGTEGGPFSPSSQIYALTNTGGASLNWAVSNSQSWVSLSATSGALAAGASTNITVSINAGANSLTAGSYSDTVTFTNATNGIGITNRSVSLTVNPPAPSTILADAGDLFAGTTNNLAPTNSVAVLVVDTGNNGFAPPQPAFPLNLGATWGADDQIVGLWDLTACDCGDGELFDETVVAYTNGVAPGQKLQLYWFPSLTLASNTLGVTYYGKYTDTNSPPLDGSDAWEIPAGGTNVHLIFWTPTWGGSNPQSAGLATLFTGAQMAVGPTNDLVSAGAAGGPFSPADQVYSLTNSGGGSLNWAIGNGQSWVSLSATSGVLAAGASTNITVSINAGANSLTASSYADTVTFTNATNGIGTTNRSVSLTVNPPAPSTILADAGDLFAGTTNNLAPTNSVAVLVADTGNNGFAPPQPAFPLNLGATWGADDQIVGLWDLTACNCGDGELFDETVVAYTNGVAPGQKLQLYWFPSLTLASNTLGVTYYGKYTDTNSPPLDGSDAWEIPAGGTNVHLIFWTPTWGGSNPQSAGLATLLTGGTSFAAWQQQYFGCTACPEAAEDADPDGDGQNNLAEFLAGTVPTNSASAFRVTAVARESNNLRVTWTMGSNKTNTLQAAAGAGNGSYSTNDFSDIFTVTNTIGWVTNYLDAGAATNFPSRFYRIRLVP